MSMCIDRSYDFTTLHCALDSAREFIFGVDVIDEDVIESLLQMLQDVYSIHNAQVRSQIAADVMLERISML